MENGKWSWEETKQTRPRGKEWEDILMHVTTSTYAYGEHSGCATAVLVWNSATNSSNRHGTANHLHILITTWYATLLYLLVHFYRIFWNYFVTLSIAITDMLLSNSIVSVALRVIAQVLCGIFKPIRTCHSGLWGSSWTSVVFSVLLMSSSLVVFREITLGVWE